ncbi:LOB domain-containing protein [Heracleum sosnowskyi]|uniref:LOB domain-containing protein n=1 Tax=Heracleum sosnowskyi TaxID=360622 RepID=A0AAD8J9Q1_9APIA|nr:LOB domain-containing protein [Heracleum sosnowskyi]
MECSGLPTILASAKSLSPRPSVDPYSLPVSSVVSPCAACKIPRRRCAETCVLAPYFPPNDPLKFTTAHRVFGASNIIKFLQELPESQRADGVGSMLQKQVNELQAQLAKAQAEAVTMQCQYSNLMALISMDYDQPRQSTHDQDNYLSDDLSYFDNINPGSLVLESLRS